MSELYVSKEEVVTSYVHVILFLVLPCASTELEKRAFGFASPQNVLKLSELISFDAFGSIVNEPK